MLTSLSRLIALCSILIAYGISRLPGSFGGSSVEAYYQVNNTLNVGDRPWDVETYNNKVYVANRDANTVSVIDALTNSISSINVGAGPSNILAFNDKIYVVNYTSGTVSIINPTTNTVISSVAVGVHPNAIAAINHKVYVGTYDSTSIYIIDTIDNSVSTLTGGDEILDMIAVNNKVYIATFDSNTVAVINSINNNISYINLPAVGWKLASHNDTLYVRNGTSGSNAVTAIDTTTDTIITNIPVNDGNSDMIVLGDKLYVAGSISNNVSIINTLTNTGINTVAVGNNPIAFTALNNNVYVANYNSDNVSIINGSTDAVSHITVGDGPQALSNINNKIYVANSLSDTVSIISNIPTITYPGNNNVLTTNIVTFTGVAEAGSTVSILNNVGSTLINTVANGNNTFVANYIANGPGVYTVLPRATFNGLINTGSLSSFSILGGQITSPADDSMTSNTNIIFSGTATSGATVDILLSGVSIGIATGDSNNTFSFNPGTSYSLGSYTVQPIFTLGGITVTGTITDFSIVAPLSVPIITSFVDNAVFTTNTINVTGTVSSGADVYFLLNGVTTGNTTGSTGNTFAYTLNSLASGNYTIQPIATLNGMTQTGNILDFSISPSIGIPVITSFADNAVFNNSVISLTGTATSGSTVTLLLNGSILGNATANSSNIFSYSFSNIANGNYTIQPIATLNWMAQTGAILNFTYIGNTGITAPVITSPAHNSTNNGAVTFYGNGMAGYVVAIVNQAGNTVINGSVNSNGIFSLGPISVPSGTYTVKAITGGNNIYGNSITITTSYNNNSNSTDYCPNGDYTSSLYDGLCGSYNNNNNNPLLPWMDDDTDDDYDIDSDVLSEVCVPYEDDGYSNDLYESLKVYKKEIFVICWMKHNGLTKHTKTGYFRGGDGLRRDESTKVIYNFLTEVLGIQAEKKNTFCNYQDLYAYNSDLKSYIKKSCEAGLYKGTQSNVNFNPSYFLKTNYFYSIVSNMIKVYQPNGDSDVSILDDISELNKNSTTKMTRLKAAHALYKLSQILYTSSN